MYMYVQTYIYKEYIHTHVYYLKCYTQLVREVQLLAKPDADPDSRHGSPTWVSDSPGLRRGGLLQREDDGYSEEEGEGIH